MKWRKTHPVTKLAMTSLKRATSAELIDLYNRVKDDPAVQPSPYNDGRIVRHFQFLKRRVEKLKEKAND